jgi:DNA-directed RNA polymerase specialized sigma24 family protein
MGDFAHEAEDVLQDFLLSLLERQSRFTPAQGRAIPWMCGLVRSMAGRRRAEREQEWGRIPEP